MKLFNRNREPTKDKPTSGNQFRMVTTWGDYYYSWNGKLYESDIVRACIRPKVKAIGKLVGKHIRDDPNNGLQINPKPYIRILLYSDILHLKSDYYDDDIFGTESGRTLAQLMECVDVIDQGIVKAIKNSGVIRWLLKFSSSMRPEDVKKNTKEFVDNYLSIESDTFGAARVDAKAEAKQIEPKDYVPNATQTDRITERIYSYFNTNKKIVQSTWTEDEWNAYYEAEVEPVAIQFGEVLTAKLFTRTEQDFGNQIIYEASNLQCASLSTKLQFLAMVDRGAMTPNEWRSTMNMAPLEGRDEQCQ